MLTGDPHLAQDLVQETMVRVQLKWRRLASVDAIEPYVRRMMVNLYLDWRRGSWLSRVLLRPFADEASRVPDEHVDQNAERDAIWQAWPGCLGGSAPLSCYISRGLATLRSAGDTEMISCPAGVEHPRPWGLVAPPAGTDIRGIGRGLRRPWAGQTGRLRRRAPGLVTPVS